MSEFSFKGCSEMYYEINEFHRIKFEIKTAIKSLKKLVVTSEISASEYEAEIKLKYGYDKNEGWECSHEDIDTLYEYRNIQRNAIFLMAYSYYEGKFKEISKLFSNKIKDEKHLQYPKNYWVYISKVCQFKALSNIHLKYDFLEMIGKVRNSITHSSNTIYSSELENQKLTELEIGELQNLGFSFRFTPQKENYVYLVFKIADTHFFDYLFKQIEEFLNSLIIEIDAKLKTDK